MRIDQRLRHRPRELAFAASAYGCRDERHLAERVRSEIRRAARDAISCRLLKSVQWFDFETRLSRSGSNLESLTPCA